jgi:glucose/arabinose dehydrogenase
LKRFYKLAGAAALAFGALGAVGATAAAPPSPTASNGNPVELVASGLNTPTSFAFGAGQVFEGDGGQESNTAPPNGGVYVLSGGKATKLADSPQFVAGLVWHGGTLYISGGVIGKTGPQFGVWAWSGWSGSDFGKKTLIWKAPKKLDGLNGIAWAPNGRLLVGVDLGLTDGNDHGPATTSPYVYDIMSLKPNGKGLKVYAKGMRQPWQIAFAQGSNVPFVSDLGQDTPKGIKAPDFLLKVHQGDNFGFPKCNQLVAADCTGFAKPFAQFKPHTDIMGLAPVGKTLYMSSFLGTTGHAGEVFSMPVAGGKAKPFVTGFVAPVVGLGTDGKYVYIGEVGAGLVYRVKVS